VTRTILLCALLCGAGCKAADASPTPTSTSAPSTPSPRQEQGQVPVLVELFTSEGCSSCPPADAVLTKLEKTQPVAGAFIVPVGLHVDYWDRLGWSDPFASPAWSARQRAYAPLGEGTYTPEAVVDGQVGMVGSRQGAVEKAVADAAKRPHAPITVDVVNKGAALEIRVTVGALPPGSAADAETLVAVTRSAAAVDVPRGENAGNRLAHTAIARDLRVLGPAHGTVSTTVTGGPDLRVVAFVQERASRRVLGTATRDLTVR
jgi:hypothetical protein